MTAHWPNCSASDLARLLGVSSALVSQWIDAGLPCTRGRTKGHAVTIDPEKALPWVLARREPPGSQRERLAKEQADKVALENAVKRRELIHTEQVTEVLTGLAADLAAQHDALPGRLASELAGLTEPAVIRGRLLDEMRGIRSAFAAAGDKLADALEGGADAGEHPAPAEETERSPVGRRKPRPASRKRRAWKVSKR